MEEWTRSKASIPPAYHLDLAMLDQTQTLNQQIQIPSQIHTPSM
jgi:hypothetical protein